MAIMSTYLQILSYMLEGVQTSRLAPLPSVCVAWSRPATAQIMGHTWLTTDHFCEQRPWLADWMHQRAHTMARMLITAAHVQLMGRSWSHGRIFEWCLVNWSLYDRGQYLYWGLLLVAFNTKHLAYVLTVYLAYYIQHYKIYTTVHIYHT